MKKINVLKTIIIILDIIAAPLLVIQAIGGNLNITSISVMLISNIIIFANNSKKRIDKNEKK